MNDAGLAVVAVCHFLLVWPLAGRLATSAFGGLTDIRTVVRDFRY